MKSIKRTIPSRREQAEMIMDSFDFERVAKAMKQMNWTWCEEDSPSVPQLRRTARSLLERLIVKKLVSISTGGLYAEVDKWGWITLSFRVTDYSPAEDLT